MKYRFLLTLVGALTISSVAFADIQSPPNSQWNWSRKLSRALANIAYGSLEVPTRWQKVSREEGAQTGSTTMIVEGTSRTVVRLGYGLYEFLTFPAPTYKNGYRPPYYKKDRFDTWYGYSEFPNQIGFSSQATYTRTGSY